MYLTKERDVACNLRKIRVNLGGGNEGGSGPPGREQDKKLTTSREGDNSIMEWEEDVKKSQA